MGGKGRKRREKNYRAAHGEKNRLLPPPPVSSSLEALPSKLRQILKFTRPNSQPQRPPQPSMCVCVIFKFLVIWGGVFISNFLWGLCVFVGLYVISVFL